MPKHPSEYPPLVSNPLFLLDYDGTLASIVPDPARAVPHPEAVEVLERLRQHHPVYLLTGRRVKELETLLPLPGLRVAGVHGMEEGVLGGTVRSQVPLGKLAALEAVRRHLPKLPGIRVEDKGLALALHYRGASDEAALEAALRAWIQAVPEGVQPLWGKKVLELRPSGFGKGEAAASIARSHPDRTPVILGDDTTDEEAFSVLGEKAVTIKVGSGPTHARWRLRDVADVVLYLKRYL